ncbi:MAG: glcF [Peptococcaceae bacterium]|jgi:glycolate oxidase iron-sulfur subunit|nr:glcF [Peptococcaceae bacterium]
MNNEYIKPYQDETERCLRCGICLGFCPVYHAERHEGTVARGKIRMTRELLEGNLQLTPRLRKFMDLCLGCQACAESCPNKIPTDKIVAAARAQFVKDQGLPLVYYLALRWGLKNPAVMETVFASLGLARNLSLTKLLPHSLKEKEEILPPLPSKTFWEQYKAKPGSGKKVAYFVGCMTNLVSPQVGLTAVRMLEAHGYEVIVPKVYCCGLPHYSSGDMDTARELALKNLDIFTTYDVEAVLTDCGSCGSALREYPHWLKDQDQSKAQEFAGKVRDITEFLVNDAGIKPGSLALNRTVTYHDSCHLNRTMGVTREPRLLLKSLPGVEYREMIDANRCCGGAGTFNIKNPEVSMKILEHKMANTKATGADTLAVGCPSCRMQLALGARKFNVPVEILHPVELLAMSYGQK